MSKSEEKTATGDARNQNIGYAKNAQTTYNTAQTDIGDYAGQLAKYAADNPFVQGGEFETAQTQQAADTAAAGAQTAGNAMQSAAVRSGGNPAAAIAATEQVSENNGRNLADEEAAQTQQRLGLESGYNQNVLNASTVPEKMEQGLLSTEAGAANNSLDQEVNAAKTPSYLDELVQGGIAAGDAFAGGAGKAVGCWIAARLWGGWGDACTVVFRLWLTYDFSRKWYGKLPTRFYQRFGKGLAEAWMPSHPWGEEAICWLFTLGLRRAFKWRKTPTGDRIFREYQRLEAKHFRERCENPQGFSDWATERAGRTL